MVHRPNSQHVQDSQLLLPVQSWVIALSHVSAEQCTHKTTPGAWLRQLTVPAPQLPSNNQHSTAEAPEILQGTLLCLSANTALPLVRIPPAMEQTQHRQPGKNPKQPQNLSCQPEFILSGLSIQVMNRLWTLLASMNCQRLQSREQHSYNTGCLVQ